MPNTNINPHFPFNLSFAAQFCAITELQYLLDQGADIEVVNNSGSTPLHLAVQCDHIGVCMHIDKTKLLLEHGASVKAKNRDGSTPLHLAVKSDYVKELECISIATLLLNYQANLEAKDN